jgi:fused signal recognition particle receptor
MFKFLKSGFSKLKSALKKTHEKLTGELKKLFSRPLDSNSIESLERLLYEADLGSVCTEEFVCHIQAFHKRHPHSTFKDYLEEMRSLARGILSSHKPQVALHEPHLILIVGTNGSGKTTSCAKLAKLYKDQGKKVLLVAADTFRAAAIEQLEIWSSRLGIEIVKGLPGGDPAAIVFDALTKAKAKHFDIVIADTAGRLDSKKELMNELDKVRRVSDKCCPGAPHETMLVLDATTGQSAIEQARVFNQFTPLSSLILTKLDGSAKGGIVLAIYRQLGIPVHFVGTGEKEGDFASFDVDEYLDGLFS